jgi:hypothetical protein
LGEHGQAQALPRICNKGPDGDDRSRHAQQVSKQLETSKKKPEAVSNFRLFRLLCDELFLFQVIQKDFHRFFYLLIAA